MNLNELKTGDVLLLSPTDTEGDCISPLIAELTGENVSHGGICYRDITEIIHARTPTVTVDEITKVLAGRLMHVMRHKDPPASFGPVVDRADFFLAAGNPFGLQNMFLLALILLYKRTSSSSPMQTYMIKVFQYATSALIELIAMNTGKMPMTCSQFIFRVYRDAGSQYEISLSKQVIDPPSSERLIGKLSPIDEVIQSGDLSHLLTLSPPIPEEIDVSARENIDWVKYGNTAACWILENLKPEPETASEADIPFNADFNAAAAGFALSFVVADSLGVDYEGFQGRSDPAGERKLLEQLGLTNKIDSLHGVTELSGPDLQSAAANALNLVQNVKPLFVTPADLLVNTNELRPKGKILLPALHS